MGIDGLIILDALGLVKSGLCFALLTFVLSGPIIQSGFRSTVPAYPLLHIDAVNNALASVSRPADVDPVLQVQHPSNEDTPSACCHVACGDLRILCPISGNGMCSGWARLTTRANDGVADPLLGFAFLQTFIDIFQEYFGGISLAIVKDNFDVVYQVCSRPHFGETRC